MPYWLRRWFAWGEWRWRYRLAKSYFIRGKNGWAPLDTWNLDTYLATVIAESCEYLRDHHMGYPASLTGDELWIAKLDSYSKAFRAHTQSCKDWTDVAPEHTAAMHDFIDHFAGLWD